MSYVTAKNLTIFRINSAIYGRTPSGRWSTVPLEKDEPSARSWEQQHKATGDDEAAFFNARRTFHHIAAGVYCDRWTAPRAWSRDERLIETATPVVIPESACGERERYILADISCIEYRMDAGHELYVISGRTQLDGSTPACIWDATSGRFVG